mgnify:FL=1|jgi:hypothetical protein
MIIRRCSQGHRIRIHRNATPGVTRTKKYRDGSTETLTYPSSYNYFVDVDGSIEKKTNSFKTAEEFYNDECAKKHSDTHGRLIIGKTKLINGVATVKDDYPSASNTKDAIKEFLSVRNIEYSESDTKDALLAKVSEL